MDIPKQIIRIATELGLPSGKLTFRDQFAGWGADLMIQSDVMHIWVDRGEFWATLESEGKTIGVGSPSSFYHSPAYEDEIRRALAHFRDFEEKRRPNKPPEAMAVERPPSSPSPAPAMPHL